MTRTNYEPPKTKATAAEFLVALVASVLLAYLLSHVGPAMDGIMQEVEADYRAQAQLQQEAHVAAAAQRQCGGDEASWIDVAPGIVDCYDKHGRRTATNVKVKP